MRNWMIWFMQVKRKSRTCSLSFNEKVQRRVFFYKTLWALNAVDNCNVYNLNVA